VISHRSRERRNTHCHARGNGDSRFSVLQLEPTLQGRPVFDGRRTCPWGRRARRGRRCASRRHGTSSLRDNASYLLDLVGGVRHVRVALAERIVGKRLTVARAETLVAHKIERDLRRRRQQQRIEMDGLALRLPLADDRDLLVNDIVGRQRMGRDEEDEDVAGAQPLLDLPLQVSAAGHQPVDPEVHRAVLDRRPQIAGHERQPLDLGLGRPLRLVRVGVADDDERLFRLGRHRRPTLNAALSLRPNSPESTRSSRRAKKPI
jgi:hypothetical protein